MYEKSSIELEIKPTENMSKAKATPRKKKAKSTAKSTKTTTRRRSAKKTVPRLKTEQGLNDLAGYFYRAGNGVAELCDFEPIEAVPAPYDLLLDHHNHMTVTVEAFYEDKVDVIVHRAEKEGRWYTREITLTTQQNQDIVQYGIVRLDINRLQPNVWNEIESRDTPLGRVLIKNNVLREVQLCGLWQISAGPALASRMRLRIGEQLFGRTALIYCDGEPAIELLEIVAPAQLPS